MKKDFFEYYTKVQLDYNKLQKLLEKVNKEIEEGLVSDAQRDNFMAYYSAVQSNYERLSYVRHLLELPPKFIRDIKGKKLIKTQKGGEAEVLNENKENLDKMENDLAKYYEGTTD